MPRAKAGEPDLSFFTFKAPSLDGHNVAFVGSTGTSNNAWQGVFAYDGLSTRAVADRDIVMPGLGSNFFDFPSAPSLDGANVAFLGRPQSLSEVGLYTDTGGGGLNTIADTANTAVPDVANDTFFTLVDPSFDGGKVAFHGRWQSTLATGGVYVHDGTGLQTVIDANDSLPGQTSKYRFSEGVSIDAGKVAFQAQLLNGFQGVYTGGGGALTAVANTLTTVPGTAGAFKSFSDVALSGDSVAFRGTGPGNFSQGVYTGNGGPVNKVADEASLGELDFDSPSVDGSNIAFLGISGGSRTLYSNLGGSLAKVIGTGDTLDGWTVGSVLFGSEGLDGNTLAFEVSLFAGNASSTAIYLADFAPPPAGGFIVNGDFQDPGLANWMVSGAGTAVDTEFPAGSGNLVANLTSGSPVILSQNIGTPNGPFVLSYDFLFQTMTGLLRVFLDATLIDELDAASFAQTDFETRQLLISDAALWNRTDVALAFEFDGPAGSQVFLDNVDLTAAPEPTSTVLFATGTIALLALRRRRALRMST